MKKTFTVIAVLTVIIASIVTAAFTYNVETPIDKPQAYVGVTYCGNSIEEGKQLIDKVKDYTNLFVLQSGLLERDLKSVDELGDYAISKGMYFLPYFGVFVQSTFFPWLDSAKHKWESHLLGVYYADEPAGKMLDGYVHFNDTNSSDKITKTEYGDIVVEKPNGTIIQYLINSDIKLYQPNVSSEINDEAIFHSNGSIQVIKAINGLDDFGFKNYQQLDTLRPFKNINDTATAFIAHDQQNIEPLRNSSVKLFTSDYALYWFDYLSGYDVVLGQIGWNMTFEQQIAFLRGAASAQNKEWGTFITWKYQQPPYLDNGTAIFNQMQQAYECGSKYLIVFNYYDEQNPQGTLKEEHFQAIHSFWDKVLNNPKIIRGTIQAHSVLILPQNYGWGARWDTDHVWGIFNDSNQTRNMWSLLQTVISKHGLNLDIIYSDVQTPILSRYQNIYQSS